MRYDTKVQPGRFVLVDEAEVVLGMISTIRDACCSHIEPEVAEWVVLQDVRPKETVPWVKTTQRFTTKELSKETLLSTAPWGAHFAYGPSRGAA